VQRFSNATAPCSGTYRGTTTIRESSTRTGGFIELGRHIDGRAVTYDKGTGAFTIGDAPVTITQVLEHDAFGQIQWVSVEIGAWV
jgi:hypothetical protein